MTETPAKTAKPTGRTERCFPGIAKAAAVSGAAVPFVLLREPSADAEAEGELRVVNPVPTTIAPSPAGDEVSGVGDAGSDVGPEEDAGAGDVGGGALGVELAGDESNEDVGGAAGEEDVSGTASDVAGEGAIVSDVGDGTADGVTVVFGSIDTSQVCTSVYSPLP